MVTFWAHTGAHEGSPEWQSLSGHLAGTARRARAAGSRIGIPNLAEAAALLHDVGKYSPEFQQYLLDSEALKRAKGPAARLGRRVDHKLLSAAMAAGLGRSFLPVAIPIAGHHGGLPDRADALSLWSVLDPSFVCERAELDGVLEGLPDERLLVSEVTQHPSSDLLLRMVYSCLVDADGLDTEGHDRPSRAKSRGMSVSPDELLSSLLRAQQSMLQSAPRTELNTIRAEVYESCLAAARMDRGCFRLTVPTGGGKTRSSLAFALSHAVAHELDRVIYVIPYTSIIDQTVAVFREVLQDERAVLAHHASAFEPMAGNADSGNGVDWRRLAADNWDAPVVVTTNVQFFESLLGSRPGRSRKVHRIARSVVVLDEVQTLPPKMLDPILDVMRSLASEWGTTFVLCSATQPAVGDTDRVGVALPGVREIVGNYPMHFDALRRVSYEIPEQSWSWADVAREMRSAESCLAIVNTRRDALTLLDELSDERALHLSTLLTPAHRKQVLDEIRDRLSNGESCRVVSTQVVEAGVDVDFPLVLRAVGPLDSIIQAAGRCNREGRLDAGRVIVFEPSDGSWSAGVYRTATELARARLRADPESLHSPTISTEYFQKLYDSVETDVERIQQERKRLNFRSVDERFHYIADDSVPVLIPGPDTEVVEQGLESGEPVRASWRAVIQAHSVSIRHQELGDLERRGLVQQLDVRGSVYRWLGAYDDVRGLGDKSVESGALIV